MKTHTLLLLRAGFCSFLDVLRAALGKHAPMVESRLPPSDVPLSPDVKTGVLESLRHVLGPDGRTPLAQSGALSDIVVREGVVYASIGVDPAQAADLEPMRARAEQAATSVPGVQSAHIVLTSEKTVSARPAVSSRPAPPPRQEVPGIKRIIAVASGKGGVGKSTTACNLALALAAGGLAVGILDADIYGPSIPTLLGLRGQPEVDSERRMRPLERYGLRVMSIGFLVEDAAPVIWRGPMVTGAVRQLLREAAWGELDVLVVDMPPGTGDIHLSLVQSTPLSGAVIVSTPQDLALIDARRAAAMFSRVGVPVLGVIENMSGFSCPACGARTDIFGHGGARQEAEQLGVPFLGEIPLAMSIRTNSDAGVPILVADPDGPYQGIYLDIATRLRASLTL